MPSVAVLATWTLTALWLALLGSPAAMLVLRRFGLLAAIRVALLFGLASALLLVLALNFFVPLRSASAVTLALLAAGVTAVIALGIHLLQRKRSVGAIGGTRNSFPYWSLIFIAALALSVIAVAHASFGSVVQYDSGLYHINAIQYASEYRVIPGLANLHTRLGVSNSQHLLTALLSNSGWGLEVLRLQIGFFVFLFALDVALRLADSRKSTPRLGTIVLLLSALGMIPFLLSNPNELITSPSPDSVALVITLIGGAYLADGMATRRSEWIATGMVVLAAAASVRTQLWAFAAMTLVVVLVYFRWGKRGWRRPRVLTMLAAALAGALVVASQARDAIQSGWLLFPLDVLPLPVDWKAFDPAASRLWIISWARSPGSSPDDVMGNWSWVGGWVVRSAADWGFRLTVGLVALALTLWLIRTAKATPEGRSRKTPLAALWLLIPTSVGLFLWFLSAPDPRFAWGLIVLLGAIPAAVAVDQTLATRAAPVSAGVAALLVLPAAIVAVANIDGELAEGEVGVTFTGVPWTISAAITPLPAPQVEPYILPTGEQLTTPVGDDRCWATFPVCRPYPNDSLAFRGDTIQDGFASLDWQR